MRSGKLNRQRLARAPLPPPRDRSQEGAIGFRFQIAIDGTCRATGVGFGALLKVTVPPEADRQTERSRKAFISSGYRPSNHDTAGQRPSCLARSQLLEHGHQQRRGSENHRRSSSMARFKLGAKHGQLNGPKVRSL